MEEECKPLLLWFDSLACLLTSCPTSHGDCVKRESFCRSPFFGEFWVETFVMTAGGVRASGKLNAAVQRVFYVGLAFAVKVEMKGDAHIIGAPL